MLIKDSEAVGKLMPAACELLEDKERIAAMERNIASLALTDAAMTIADEVYRIIEK
jgi:UDP-N-acetylglucosamine:LPS N-acetylglucosamine transferase